jgi:hypothetical protein
VRPAIADADDGHAIEQAVRELRALGSRLDDATRLVERLARVLDEVWRDDRGRDWADRLGLVCGELARETIACQGLAGGLTRVAEELASARCGVGEQQWGPLLGDTAARRANPDRGMRIATLPEPADPQEAGPR